MTKSGFSFLYLVVWLAFAVAPSPIPGQTAKEPAKASNQSKDRSSTKQVQAPAPPIINPNKPEVKQNASQAVANADKPRSIRVAELPPLPLGKDWMDRVAWFTGMILVAVGVLGVYLANRTLKAVERQANVK